MIDDYPSKLPPGDLPESDLGRQVGARRESRLIAFSKNVLIFCLLVGVVVASFWVSFQLGKKILLPTRKLPERISVTIPEPPPAIKSLQKLQAMMSAEAEGERTDKPSSKAARSKKKKAKKRLAAQPGQRAYGQHYYKVQAGLFVSRAEAQALADKLTADGVAVFIRKVGGRWRVQAGAYRTRGAAAAMGSSLIQKGYQSEVIYE
ncbi:MAG: SPOR domain-containing protein [Candidatus Saganbacteria bacterium]|nr:SPOR domain-containing protein [Candidatus Saganbacteria bacterium]